MSEARGAVAYVDTSALVKLVVREAESTALEHELRRGSGLATSTITGVELARAVARSREAGRESVADDDAVADLLGAVAEIPLTGRVRSDAGSLHPVELRTLDAIHLASAIALGDALSGVITYDQRMAGATEALGLRVIAPGQ